jgi:hypothetical protein
MSRSVWVCAGAALFYTGGMFLNDAVDADWDRQHRPERPIPAGLVSRASVYAGAVGMFVTGWLLMLPAGGRTALLGLALVVAIVVYDLVHKQVEFAPLLMAGCRGLLYLTAAAAGSSGLTRPALLGALAITGYIAGLSFLARRESTDHRMPRWPILLLLAPVGMALVSQSGAIWPLSTILAGTVCLLWTAWCLRHTAVSPVPNIGQCVSGLLAGIPLTDGLAAAGGSWLLTGIFGGLFFFARGWQRFVPAT